MTPHYPCFWPVETTAARLLQAYGLPHNSRWRPRLPAGTDPFASLSVFSAPHMLPNQDHGRIATIYSVQSSSTTEADGVIKRYAIGGAVGATFYLEPVATLDVDIFTTYRIEAGSLMISPQPIFNYLKARGCTMEGECIVVGGRPVQFLPTNSPLAEEALREAATRDVSGIPARVCTAEHLAAIALQTGRAKDKARVLQFVESGALDAKKFQTILQRHGLVPAWEKFEKQFLTP